MFKELDEYCSKLRIDYKAMVFAYIIDTGFRDVKEITDKDVENMRKELKKIETGREIMTVDFKIDLVNTARDIVNLCESPTELYQYSAIKEIFDLDYYAPGECTPREQKILEVVKCFAQYEDEQEREEINETLEVFGKEWKL